MNRSFHISCNDLMYVFISCLHDLIFLIHIFLVLNIRFILVTCQGIWLGLLVHQRKNSPYIKMFFILFSPTYAAFLRQSKIKFTHFTQKLHMQPSRMLSQLIHFLRKFNHFYLKKKYISTPNNLIIH